MRLHEYASTPFCGVDVSHHGPHLRRVANPTPVATIKKLATGRRSRRAKARSHDNNRSRRDRFLRSVVWFGVLDRYSLWERSTCLQD